MATFRRVGGLNYASNNNITRTFISNNASLNINKQSGYENSKETFRSHIDMSGNSILHVTSIEFQDGTIQTTAYSLNSQSCQQTSSQETDKSQSSTNYSQFKTGINTSAFTSMLDIKDGQNNQSELFGILIEEIQELKKRVASLELKK